MHSTRVAALLFGTLAASGILWAATAQEKKPDQDKPVKQESPEKKEMVFVAADQAKFKEVAPGASMAVIWGDPDKGAHRSFTKFVPGATFPLHTHTSEMHIVVIKGAYLYKPEKGEEKRVGPGCYIDIPGGDRHSSGGDAKEGALFYEESAGKFDLVPVDKDKK
jgi:quercetin dioxygenase-like cupin family protein